MAYAAVTCLYHTIHHLLESCRISVTSSTAETLTSALSGAEMLQRALERYDEIKNSSEGVMAMDDAQIRDEARRLEDAIESQASAQFLSQPHQIHGDGTLSLNLHDHLRHDIDCFVETAKKMSEEYMEELYKLPWPPSPHEEASAAAAASAVSSTSDVMVGFSDQFFTIRDFVARDQTAAGRLIIRFVVTGMAGIGKTTMVKKLFHDSFVKEKFQHRAFVRVGQKYEFEQIIRAIAAQLNIDSHEMAMEGDDENVDEYLKRSLRGRKFLIVLDDVWGVDFEKKFVGLLPENCDGSFLLVTSRIQDTFRDTKYCNFCYPMWFLNEEESWELLRRKVFGEGGGDYCPPQLVKAGKKIAEKCEGLPLLIIAVAALLLEAPKSPGYWNEVAEERNSVFEDACDQIYDLLLPSYHYMTQNSKACFLYMGVFPKGYLVRRSRVINLWRAERFAAGAGSSILDYIVSSNLLLIRQKRLSLFYDAKAFNLHVVYRHLSRREGENSKFVCILNRYATDDSIEERLKGKRRLAIHHNTLLAMKEVHNSIGSSVPTLRSLLCTGPYHQYQVPICLELRLLRVLDAVNIRFYEFPAEVVELVQLRYLSLTTNASLPPSINKLCFLRFLIVHQHLRIISWSGIVVESSSYVPVEIWELQELEHLQIVGRNLPHPPRGAILPNLRKLLDVGVQSCTKGILESIPKLEKLRIQIESAPGAAQTDISCFDHVSCLPKLESLRSAVVNPNLLSEPAAPRRLLSISSSSIGKLSLSGFGYPWNDMSKIAELPNLRLLKLQCYAFRGEMWEAKEMRFSLRLECLLIEDTDLVRWSAGDETFPSLRRLIMMNCHKLREIPLLKSLYHIEIEDCNPLAETWANQKVECGVEVKYSWK